MSKPKFLILGNPNAITYKEIFPLIKDNKIWLGYKSMGSDMYFHVTSEFAEVLKKTKKEGSGYVIINNEILGRAQAIWFSNLDVSKRHNELKLTKSYYEDTTLYPTYDNYDAIEVSKTNEIPKDYFGNIGVPITFLDKYNPEQFEIIDLNPHFFTIVSQGLPKPKQLTLKNRKDPYARILIKRKIKHPKFLIIGNQNAFTYKEIFPLIKDNKIWVGYNMVKEFKQPDGSIKKFGNICWFSNLDVSKRHEDLILYEKYYNKDGAINSDKFPTYDNYDAINVNKTHEIPKDYFGAMGVPITFLDKYNPEQFEIIKFRKGNDEKDLSINKKCPYFRILIKRKYKDEEKTILNKEVE